MSITSVGNTPKLFQPYTLRSLTLRNRIVVAPMAQYSSVDGFANDWHLVHLGSFAVGGAALVMQEGTAVEAQGRTTLDDMGIYRDEHIEMLSHITSFIRERGALAGIELSHAGGKGSSTGHRKGTRFGLAPEDGGWQTVAPSAIAFADNYPTPIALTKNEIAKIVQRFAEGAQRSVAAGFQVIELLAGHGYLLHQFLSPLSNQRNDEYGGSLYNRMRFLLEITDAVRQVMPEELPLLVRISATDWLEEGGVTLAESIEIARELKKHHVDLIEVSTGGNSKDATRIPVGPGYQVPFAEAIRREAQIPTGAVGMITQSQQANTILQQEQADLIFIAREFLRDPHWPLRAAHELSYDIAWPWQYMRARP